MRQEINNYSPQRRKGRSPDKRRRGQEEKKTGHREK